ncbi:hypothetical protein EGR_03742 [Echinococcus granulosus]|uniref:Uncharacterized protein n=1 Tax=Echinococcus granulosus TaxID=6210 RepID=W6UT04_ECHGR|nr:hypothetical protein EGR_03742 [Echinococcus granulosus]EUB61452.1 hypothetical protein EGR_03742 [Echinococcus granulosus]
MINFIIDLEMRSKSLELTIKSRITTTTRARKRMNASNASARGRLQDSLAFYGQHTSSPNVDVDTTVTTRIYQGGLDSLLEKECTMQGKKRRNLNENAFFAILNSSKAYLQAELANQEKVNDSVTFWERLTTLLLINWNCKLRMKVPFLTVIKEILAKIKSQIKYPSAPPMPPFPVEGEYVYEIPGLAIVSEEEEKQKFPPLFGTSLIDFYFSFQPRDGKEVTNPLVVIDQMDINELVLTKLVGFLSKLKNFANDGKQCLKGANRPK